MKIIKKVINNSKSKILFPISNSMENKEDEITVSSIKKEHFRKVIDVDNELKSITGIIADKNKTLDKYKEERLKKYECDN